MRIRKANALDRRAIMALVRAHPDTLAQDHLPRTGEFMVAVDGKPSCIVGCAALVVYSRRMAELRSVAVAEGNRGKGIGSALIDACLKEAKRRKVREVLAVTGAKELFERHGFDTFNREKYAMLRTVEE